MLLQTVQTVFDVLNGVMSKTQPHPHFTLRVFVRSNVHAVSMERSVNISNIYCELSTERKLLCCAGVS